MLEQEKQCSKQYARPGAPIVATEPGYDTAFCVLSGRVSQLAADGQQWEEIKALSGGHVLLGQESDEVFTWVRGWSLGEGLSEAERQLVPCQLLEERGGYYQRSVLGPGPFRYLDIDFSREQLLAVLGESQSQFVGVSYQLEEPDHVTIHPTGGDFKEWSTIHFRGATPVLERHFDGLTMTLYRVNESLSWRSFVISPELYVGFQSIKGEEKLMMGPELLLRLEEVLGEGAPQCWGPDELRATLTRGERKWMPGYFGLNDEPKLKKKKSRS